MNLLLFLLIITCAHANVTVTLYEDAALPLENLCKQSIPPKSKLIKPKNRLFQILSWDVGCEKRKSTLAKCNTACNNGCCGTTCAGNSCSGGGCCTASKNICKEACNFMFAPQVYDIIQYTNVKNETRFINKTRWFNKTYTIERIIWVNKHTNQSHYPTVISEKFENTTHTFGKPITVNDLVIWGSCLVIGFMGGCFFSYVVFKFKEFVDSWFGCLDCHSLIKSSEPPPKKIDIQIHPGIDTLRRSNSPKARKRMEI